MNVLWDDPTKDFRQRYQVPEHFVWDDYDLAMIDYLGYTRVSLALLPAAPAAVLDVGCGDGWVANQVLQRGHSVTGIDYSGRAIAFARALTPTGSFQQMDIRELDTATELRERFDAALCIEVIEHVPTQHHDRLLSGIHNTLRENAFLIATVPSTKMPLNDWHYKHFTEAEFLDLLERARFGIDKVVYQRSESVLWAPLLWKLLKNRHYDLRFVRRILRPVLLKKYNLANTANKAGRFIVRGVKK